SHQQSKVSDPYTQQAGQNTFALGSPEGKHAHQPFGGACPPYCTGPGQPNTNCICDTDQTTGYLLSDCQASKVCTEADPPIGCTPTCTIPYGPVMVPQDSCFCKKSFDPSGCRCPLDPLELTGIRSDHCPCLPSGDIRQGTIYCNITDNCIEGVLEPSMSVCLCNENYLLPGCICTAQNKPKDCKTFLTPLPPITFCFPNIEQPTNCTCTQYDYHDGCTCPDDRSQLMGISPAACACNETGDPRAGGTCKVTEECNATLNPTIRGCFCTSNYQPDGCTCTSAIHPDNEEGCVCDQDEDAVYDLTTCRATKTCIEYNNPIGCRCASDDDVAYGKTQCQSSKVCTGTDIPEGCTPNCTATTQESVELNSCFCTATNNPSGCRCPIDSLKLTGIPISRCACRPTGDIRGGTTCLATDECIEGVLVPSDRNCLCNANYQPSGCMCNPPYSPLGCKNQPPLRPPVD
ncbi:MAG: hypothetical protein EZS28_012673, partial [Streblomastix strix]